MTFRDTSGSDREVRMLTPTRCWLLLLIVAGCSGANAFTTPQNVLTDPESRTKPKRVFLVEMETSKGTIVMEIHPEWAPIGARRFRELVQEGFYDECRFFRTVPGFVVQTGMNGDPLVQGQWKDKKLRDDPVLQSNKRGYVTFATSGTDSRTTQFFINLAHNAQLDKMGFAPIGVVVEGLDVVEKLEQKYGEEADQQLITSKGNDYLKANFPDMDYIVKARLRSTPDESDEAVTVKAADDGTVQ